MKARGKREAQRNMIARGKREVQRNASPLVSSRNDREALKERNN